jgi:hypothetical protein
VVVIPNTTQRVDPSNDELEEDRWLGHTCTRQLAIKAFADGDFFELRKSNPRAQMPGYLSRKAPTSIFAIDKASVAFREERWALALVGGVRRGGTVVQGACA